MKLPFRYRGLVWLVLLVIVLPGITWCLALQNTCAAWRDCHRLNVRLSSLKPCVRPPTVRQEMPELILSGLLLDSVRLATEVYGARVLGYEPQLTLRQESLGIHTAQISITGSYVSLLRVIDRLECSLPSCRLLSLKWRVAPDRHTRLMQLTTTLYIQQIILNKPRP